MKPIFLKYNKQLILELFESAKSMKKSIFMVPIGEFEELFEHRIDNIRVYRPAGAICGTGYGESKLEGCGGIFVAVAKSEYELDLLSNTAYIRNSGNGEAFILLDYEYK